MELLPPPSEHVLFSSQQCAKRVVPQPVVLIEILITQSQAPDVLAHQYFHTLLDERLKMQIGETPG